MEDYSNLTPPSQIADILRQLQEAGLGQEAQLAELVRQGMTQGLGVSQNRGTPELGFTGGPGAVAGYAGPLRPSDRPDGGNPNWRPSDVINMTGMKQAQYNDAVDKQAVESRMVGGRRLDDIMGMLGASKGLDKEVQQGMANKIMPGLIPQEAQYAPPSGATGADVLANAPPGIANIVKQVAEYRMPIAGFGGIPAKMRATVLPLVAAYDPSFDAKLYPQRQSMMRDFTSGKQSNNIRSLNTAIAHLDTLRNTGDALDNAGTQVWNFIANKGLEATGDPRVTKFNNAATAVEAELATVFKGTSGTDQEIKQWRKNISSSQSPEQLRENIETVTELLKGRMGAVQDIWEKGMGKPLAKPLLSDKAQQTLDRIQQSRGASQPDQPRVQQQPAQDGGTVQMRAPDGSVYPVPRDQVEAFKKKGAVVDAGGY